MTMTRTMCSNGVIVGALLALAGCGGESSDIQKVVVEGVVTFDGQPVANGEVRFYPAQGTHGPVSGGPVREGKYIAQGRGGVPVGKHTVEILGFRPPAGANRAAHPEGAPVEQYLPDKFNERTELNATITADADPATLNFALTSR